MKDNPHIGQFFSAEEEPCPSLEEMQGYAAGKLPAEERHVFERHLLNCELCSFAYEGLAGEDPVEVVAAVGAITEEAWNRVGEREKRKRRGIFIWMSGAAAILLLIVAGYFVIDKPEANQDLIAMADEMLEEGEESAIESPNANSQQDKGEVDLNDGLTATVTSDSIDGSLAYNGLKKDIESGSLDDAFYRANQPLNRVDEFSKEKEFADDIAEEEYDGDVSVDAPLHEFRADNAPVADGFGWTTIDAKDVSGKMLEEKNSEDPSFLGGSNGTVLDPSPDVADYNGYMNANKPQSTIADSRAPVVGNTTGGMDMLTDSSTYVYSSPPSVNEPLQVQDGLMAANDRNLDSKNEEFEVDQDGGDLGSGGEFDDFEMEDAEEESLEGVEEVVASVVVEEPFTLSNNSSTGTVTEQFTTIAGEDLAKMEPVEVEKMATRDQIGEISVADVAGTSSTTRKNRDKKSTYKGKKSNAKGPGNRAMTSSDEAQRGRYELGVEQFQREEFSQAAVNLRQAAADTPDNLNAHLLAAKSFLQLKQPNAAIYHLDRVLAAPNNSLEEDAKWYKSIALLQLGDKAAAQKLLEDVKSEGGKRSKSATKALNKF